jgi:hypothetical protein
LGSDGRRFPAERTGNGGSPKLGVVPKVETPGSPSWPVSSPLPDPEFELDPDPDEGRWPPEIEVPGFPWLGDEGYAKAEVGRIWLFLIPLAAVSIGPQLRGMRLRPVLLVMVAQALLVETIFGTTW